MDSYGQMIGTSSTAESILTETKLGITTLKLRILHNVKASQSFTETTMCVY